VLALLISPGGTGPSRQQNEVALNGDAAWPRLRMGITAAALGAALTDRPGALGNYLVGASLVVGAAISSTILMLP
jgi:hypothetical protein